MRWLDHPVGRAALILLLAAFVAGGLTFIHLYNVYAQVIDARLSAPIFNPTSLVFAAPETVNTGENLTQPELVNWLRRAGYAQDSNSPVGRFTQAGDSVLITPGPEATVATSPVDVQFQDGAVTAITNTTTQAPLATYALEPELVTTLFDENREKRRLVHYSDLPPTLINAVLDIEDENYFHHGAVDWPRVIAAAYRDIRSGSREQGASTITMQVARNIFDLGFQRTFRRKLTEVLVAMELEERLTKEQIFELYANQLYLGQRGSYSIHGFGEAADAYFNEDVGELTLPQCALLAGIIHGPNLDSPYRHPKRAIARRNQVLRAMLKAGAITAAQAQAAEAAPLKLAPANTEGSDAPYFMDMVRDRLSDQIPIHDLTTQSYRIYTTLNPDLQDAAAKAVTDGLKIVDAEVKQMRAHLRHRPKIRGANAPAQVALVALDPHTGAVLALVGGRSYAESQLNHAMVERPTGSIFKPIVYATALETGLLPNIPAITQTSTLIDEPTTFPGGYQPANFENKYFGKVTLRQALEHSLNNATISLAEEVGLNPVTDLAHSLGIVNAQPTPSEAIGTYNASPMTMAGAYTAFANGGVMMPPEMITAVRNNANVNVFHQRQQPKQVIDPRIAFLVTNLMESVINKGTGIRVREDGYDYPVAGKTGSSHDAWFAGYTNNLLCVVWVGLDDYENLNIEGSHAALPIWVDFMKAAATLPGYSNIQPFAPPPGVVAVNVDTESDQVATPLCPPAQVQTDYYLDGTQPTTMCHLHPTHLFPGGIVNRAMNALHLGGESPPPPPEPPPTPVAQVEPEPPSSAGQAGPNPAQKPAKQPPQHRGFFGRILHAIGGN